MGWISVPTPEGELEIEIAGEKPTELELEEIEEQFFPMTRWEQAGTIGAGATSGLVGLIGDMLTGASALMNRMPETVVSVYEAPMKIAGALPVPGKKKRKEMPTITESLGSDAGVPDYGGLARQLLAKTGLGYEKLQDVRQEARPYAVGGEVLGRTLPFAAGPFLAPARLAQGTSAIAPIVRGAKTRPVAFAEQEAAFGAASGVGGGLAEKLFPGDETARLVGELLPLSPTVLGARALPAALQTAKRAYRTLTPAGRQGEAAQVIQQQVKRMGGDPEELARRIGEGGPVKPLTPGQITGDDALVAIENKMMSKRPEHRGDMADQAQLAMKAFNEAFGKVAQTGDPKGLQVAAQSRLAVMESLRDNIIARANTKLEEATAAAIPPRSKQQLSLQARNILDEGLRDLRTEEKRLWSLVPKAVTLQAPTTQLVLDEIKDALLPGEKMPTILAAVRKELRGDRLTLAQQVFGEPTAAKEIEATKLFKLRTEMLDTVRDLYAQGRTRHARMYKITATAVLQDLDQLGSSDAVLARDFSKGLNDKFTRGSVGRLLRFSSRGGPEVPPELSLSGANLPKVKGQIFLRDLRQAAGLDAGTEAAERVAARTNELKAVQSEYLLSLAGDVGNFSGTVKPQAVENFIRTHSEALNDLGITSLLGDVAEAARVAQRVTTAATKRTKIAKAKSVTSGLLPGANVDGTIRNVLRNSDRNAQLRQLGKLAQLGGRDGLQYSVIQQLLDAATSRGGTVSGQMLQRILGGEQNGVTLARQLIDNNVLSQKQMDALQKLSAEASRFEAALGNQQTLDDLLDREDVIANLLMRIGGANIGAMGAVGQVTGTPIVVAGAGSQAAQAMFSKMPRLKVQDVIVEAIKNPELMATLLRKPTSLNQQMQLRRQINAFLLQAGIPPEKEEK